MCLKIFKNKRRKEIFSSVDTLGQ